MKKVWIYVLIAIIIIVVIIVIAIKPESVVEQAEEVPFPEDLTEEESGVVVDLTELELMEGSQDYGELQINKSVDGNELTLNREVYEKGLGTHANSVYKYSLDENYSYFEASFGLDDESSCNNVALFVIQGDGEILYTSEPVRPFQDAVYIKIPVSEIESLSLITEGGDDGINCDHTDWLNPILVP